MKFRKFNFKSRNFKFLQISIILSLIFVMGYYFSNSLYGDKKNVLQEIENNSKNTVVQSDNNALEVALSLQRAIRNVAKSVSPSVVNIRTERIVKKRSRRGTPYNFFDFFGDEHGFDGPQKMQSLGSGFVISKDGYIVTNNHVVQDADEITILFSDEKEYKGKIVGRDTRTDIAVIKIEPKHTIPVTPIGNSDEVQIGDFAIAIGNPFGLKGSFTLGVISARSRDDVDADAGLKNYIQTDASINQGNSGGPLLNINGQAIGMNTAIYSTSGGSVGIGFAIPMNIVKRVVVSLIEKGVVERGYLGVIISQTPQEVAKHLDVDKKAGIFVQDVESGSPADKAGIKPGDLILKVENHDIHSVSQLQRVISSYKKGQKITTQILRNKEKINLTVVLGEMSTTKITKKGKSYVGPSKEFLGLVIGSVGDNYQQFKLDKNIKGVVVIELEENSPAESSGIKVGDIIQTINYVDISSMKDFEKFVSANKGKKGSYLVKIKRRGRNQFLVIENK